MSYNTAKQKILQVQDERNDGANTANRVGDAMLESLDYTKGKPDSVDITDYETSGVILPLSSYYTHEGKPTYSRIGTYDSTDFLAIIVATWGNSKPNTLIYLYTKDEHNLYRFNNTFYSNDDDLTNLEKYVIAMVAGTPVSYTRNGLMTSDDKRMFDEMVTEVFPLTVGVVSSNAGSFEIGTSVTPQIVLSITRKGADIPASEITENITPNPVYISPDKRTISGNQISSGTTTYQIAVTQGGQTKSVANQVFNFMDYRYRGVVEANQKPTASTVKAFIEGSWRNTNKELSNVTTLAATGNGIQLQAGKYYLFAVKQPAQGTPVTLIVKNANSGGTIDVSNTDKGSNLQITRVNGSGSEYYSWVIVPSAPSTWFFRILNS